MNIFKNIGMRNTLVEISIYYYITMVVKASVHSPYLLC